MSCNATMIKVALTANNDMKQEQRILGQKQKENSNDLTFAKIACIIKSTIYAFFSTSMCKNGYTELKLI